MENSIIRGGARLAARLALAAAVLAPALALGYGGHDKVGCRGCHVAVKGKQMYDLPPNTSYLDPRTKKPYSGSTAFCLMCHLETDVGGRGHLPVSRQHSHPFGLETVNPRIARVPAELLAKDGRFDCMACHDPHPSNRNYKYVRLDVGPKGERMDGFCAVCHSAKADAAKSPPLSLDAEGSAAAPAQATPRAPKAGAR